MFKYAIYHNRPYEIFSISLHQLNKKHKIMKANKNKAMFKIEIELKGLTIHTKYFAKRYKAFHCFEYLTKFCPQLENARVFIESIPFDKSLKTEDLLW